MTVEKRNIFLTNTAETMPFVSKPRGKKFSYPERDVKSHADLIKKKLQDAYKSDIIQKKSAAIRYKDGVYLEFSSAEKHDLAFQRLENRKQGIRLLNVKKDLISETVKATVYIPAGKESYFIKKVESYATESTKKVIPKIMI